MSKIKGLLIVLLLCGVGMVSARVFRARDLPAGQLNTVALGWNFAYQTSMNVNGVHNDLVVYAAHPNDPVAAQLRAQFEGQGASVSFRNIGGSLCGVARFKDRETRIMVLSGPELSNPLVFLFYPDPAKAATPARLPVPEFPGALAGKTVMNDETGAICRTITTGTDVAQVQAFYATALFADGWTTILPACAGASRMTVYQKGAQICSVLAAPRSDGLNRVTVLVSKSSF